MFGDARQGEYPASALVVDDGRATVRRGADVSGLEAASAACGWVMVGPAIHVYEHAYVRDFGATPDGPKQYVDPLFRNVNRDHVNRQLIQAEAAKQGADAISLQGAPSRSAETHLPPAPPAALRAAAAMVG
jgi:hypothetical protein